MSMSSELEKSGNIIGQYFTIAELEKEVGKVDLSDFTLQRMDSYSDKEIAQTIRSTGKMKELLCAAIQTAVVGMGSQKYGSMRIKTEVIDIGKLYAECGVKTRLKQGETLLPGDLTGRRLQRFFRKQIGDYIELKNQSSYLWRKYSTQNEKFKKICFPGGEHLVITTEEARFLIDTYKHLDKNLGTAIAERVQRVLDARGIKM